MVSTEKQFPFQFQTSGPRPQSSKVSVSYSSRTRWTIRPRLAHLPISTSSRPRRAIWAVCAWSRPRARSSMSIATRTASPCLDAILRSVTIRIFRVRLVILHYSLKLIYSVLLFIIIKLSIIYIIYLNLKTGWPGRQQRHRDGDTKLSDAIL